MEHKTIHDFMILNIGSMMFSKHRNFLYLTLEFVLQEKFNLEFSQNDE